MVPGSSLIWFPHDLVPFGGFIDNPFDRKIDRRWQCDVRCAAPLRDGLAWLLQNHAEQIPQRICSEQSIITEAFDMRALTARSPFLSPHPRDFDNLIGRFLGTSNDWFPIPKTERLVPPLESFYRDGELVVRVDVPGIDPKALDISVEGDRLRVKGERQDSSEENKNGRSYREVVYGAFERTVTLPWDVDSDSVKASCKDGVLEISMKAPEKVGAKKIPVVQ
jgi:HSP20 family protein